MDFNSYIGRQTRVVSKQNVRYSGTMQFIDPVAQKIRVTNVRCFGTEDRPADVFMPPLEHPFNLVEFNVGDLNDLKFEDEIPPSIPTPPAAPSSGRPNAAAPTDSAPLQQQSQPQQRPVQSTHATNFSAEKAKPPGAVHNSNAAPMPQPQQQPNIYTATGRPSSSDTLQRAMDAMTLNDGPAPRSNGVSPAPVTTNAQPGGGHRGGGQGRRGRGGGRTNGYQQGRDHHRQPHHIENKVPASDFDFQASNQKFDKAAAARQHSLLVGAVTDSTSGTLGSSDAPQVVTPPASGGDVATPVEEGATNDGQTDKAKSVEEKLVYNPSKSFFDNISSDANSKKPAPRPPGERGAGPRSGSGEPGAGHGGRGRGRGGGYGRSRRDEEREKNVATFGEPGGVGLLGPGAYVGGYGGYRGRRRRGGQGGGGGRGARGAAGGGGPPRVAAA